MPILFGLICSCLADRDWGASALGETKGYANPYPKQTLVLRRSAPLACVNCCINTGGLTSG